MLIALRIFPEDVLREGDLTNADWRGGRERFVHPPGYWTVDDPDGTRCRVKGEDPKRRGFEATAIPHMDALHGTALYLCHNPDDAADVLQETYLRAYRFWHQFTPGTNCKAWLLTILHNA